MALLHAGIAKEIMMQREDALEINTRKLRKMFATEIGEFAETGA